MRKRFHLVLAILFVAALALMGWRLASSPREPSYQGQSVGHWIKVLNSMRQDERGVSFWEGDRPILEIGPAAIPYLIKALKTKDNFANRAWVALSPKLPSSIQRKLPRPIPAALLRASAARGLGLFGPDAAIAVPDLIEALHDKDIWVRTAAASTFEKLGLSAKAAVPELISGLNDPKTRLGCVIGLNGAGPESAEVVPAFQTLLSDSDSNIRSWAIMGLGRMTVEHELVVKALEQALKDEDTNIQALAAASLAEIGAPSAVPALLKILSLAQQQTGDSHAEVMSWRILESLESMGPAAHEAAPALINYMNSPNPMISAYAARALWAIEPHNTLTIPRFIEILKPAPASDQKSDSQHKSAQYWVLRALVKMGSEAAAALPFARQHVGAGNDQNDLAAAAAIWSLSPTNPPPLELLQKAYRSQAHIMVRRTAIEIMGDLGPAARPMVSLLREAARDADELMRRDARVALEKVERIPESASRLSN